MDTTQEQREKFQRILKTLDLVLMNKIPEVDPEIWENFGDNSPLSSEPCDWFINNATTPSWCCNTHMFDGTGDYPASKPEAGTDESEQHPDECDFAENDLAEVYQWFACNESDADFLRRHNQYVTYSDLLDCHFLAITHFGTAWDYTSMVYDFIGESS